MYTLVGGFSGPVASFSLNVECFTLGGWAYVRIVPNLLMRCLSELGLLELETDDGQEGKEGDGDGQLERNGDVTALAGSSSVVAGERDVL